MQLIARLQNPFTKEERLRFKLKYQINHKLKDTDEALEAYGYTEEERQEQEKQQLILELKQQLNNLDLKSIRALRSNDTEYIELHEQQAVELRNRLKELQRKEDEE